jgi:hypothetical protein
MLAESAALRLVGEAVAPEGAYRVASLTTHFLAPVKGRVKVVVELAYTGGELVSASVVVSSGQQSLASCVATFSRQAARL